MSVKLTDTQLVLLGAAASARTYVSPPRHTLDKSRRSD